MSKQWTVARLGDATHRITFDGISSGWSQRVLLTGDRHHDNIYARWDLERRHLDTAKELGAPIIDVGDLFCMMQGKFDKRKDARQLRPQYVGENYFDLVIDDAADFYAPYADHFAVLGYGNHETSVIRHHEFDPIKSLARRLKEHATRPDTCDVGSYGGWVFFTFKSGKTKTLKLKYHHGAGGGGPVTKGVIQTNRRAVFLPDADFVVTGHIHEAWAVNLARERVSERGVVSIDNQTHVCVPTYKDEYAQGTGGFHIETGRPPKPTGCVWLEFAYNASRHGDITSRVILDV